ncbi:MAG: glycosyltransferase family 25 protein [Nitrospiraceae bacterium]|nr:MAG: glycosyltransferase family 25 protein [Nitrospiraceae bacterium]
MKAYIIHVSDAYERERYIRSQIADKNLDCSFILYGDKKDLSEEVLEKYFAGEMKTVVADTSCAFKHILSYEEIIKQGNDIALILEDDISFYLNFNDTFDKVIKDIKQQGLRNFIVSLEDSYLKYVKGSERKKGTYVYPKSYGRTAGAYLIDLQGAKSIIDQISKNKCHLPIGWFHNHCSKNKVLNIYWSHPVMAIQGSLDGTIRSLIDNKKFGVKRVLSFKLQRLYKRLLYALR